MLLADSMDAGTETSTTPEPPGKITPTRRSNSRMVVFRSAQEGDAEGLVSSYEKVFGEGGIKASGHEPYPASEVFTTSGIKQIINNRARDFIVAESLSTGQIAGGMIVNHSSPYHCDFGCVSVNPDFQGQGISSNMLQYARGLADMTSLTVNTTEIVTHSVLSQTAHHTAGFDKITGFGFCQYPRVFFKGHPESCLWISEIQGRVASVLRQNMPRMIVDAGRHSAEFCKLFLEERAIAEKLANHREVYVPVRYKQLVAKILLQFDDVLHYRLSETAQDSVASPSAAQFKEGENFASETVDMRSKLDLSGDDPYCYISLPDNVYSHWKAHIDSQLHESIVIENKRYIQARIPANGPDAVHFADYLRTKGFVFLGMLPLFQTSRENPHSFRDVLCLQWIAPHVVASNALPGETDSVIKLYGHPVNLTGEIVRIIRQELRSRESYEC